MAKGPSTGHMLQISYFVPYREFTNAPKLAFSKLGVVIGPSTGHMLQIHTLFHIVNSLKHLS